MQLCMFVCVCVRACVCDKCTRMCIHACKLRCGQTSENWHKIAKNRENFQRLIHRMSILAFKRNNVSLTKSRYVGHETHFESLNTSMKIPTYTG